MPAPSPRLTDAAIERLVEALATTTRPTARPGAAARDPAAIYEEARRLLSQREATVRSEASTVASLLDRLRADLPATPQARAWLVGPAGTWAGGRFVLRNRGPSRASFTFRPQAPLQARFQPGRAVLDPWQDQDVDLEAEVPEGIPGQVLRREVAVDADGRHVLTLWVDLEVERPPSAGPA